MSMQHPEIHPAFLDLPDISFAKVCTEALNGDFKFSSNQSNSELYDMEGFPPVPSYITSMTATYLENTPEGIPLLWSQSAFVDKDLVTVDEIADQYNSSVGVLKKDSSTLDILDTIGVSVEDHNPNLSGLQNLQAWYLSKVMESENQLVAGFITAKTVKENQLIDAIITPSIVFDELPLFARDAIAKILPAINTSLEDEFIDPEYKEVVDKATKAFLQNDPILESLGSFVTATFLPDTKVMAGRLQAGNKNRLQSKPKGNRAQRRKQQRKK